MALPLYTIQNQSREHKNSSKTRQSTQSRPPHYSGDADYFHQTQQQYTKINERTTGKI